jgi:hypothetical protein
MRLPAQQIHTVVARSVETCSSSHTRRNKDRRPTCRNKKARREGRRGTKRQPTCSSLRHGQMHPRRRWGQVMPIAIELEPPPSPLTPTPTAAAAARTDYSRCSPRLRPPPSLAPTTATARPDFGRRRSGERSRVRSRCRSRWNYPEGRGGGSFPGHLRGGKAEMWLDSYWAWPNEHTLMDQTIFLTGQCFPAGKTVSRGRTGWNERGLIGALNQD